MKALQDKDKEPESPKSSRAENVTVTIDMGDEAAVARAIKHGYLTQAEVDELEEEQVEEDPPKRRARFE